MKLPHLTEGDIRRYTDPGSFQRGYRYYLDGAILDPVRQENELRAECMGSQPLPYSVTVTLDEKGIADYECSCPRGGFCKHIVALLLTWIYKPESFRVIPPLDELLAERSREELIALIKEMLARHPDLVRLVELPLQPSGTVAFEPEAFRRQIQYALSRDSAEWAARELERLLETANRYLEAGNPIAAGTIYHLILSETVRRYEDWWTQWDEDGEISCVLGDCAEGLDRCLEPGVAGPEARRQWLEALLEATLRDIELGGIDLAWPADEVLLRRATDEEWEWIEERVRREIQGARDWRRECLVRFLAARLEMKGREDAAAALLLEQGTPEQRAFLLVKLGRVEEALEIARQHFANLPGLVLRLADALVEAGHQEEAVAYVAAEMSRGRLAWHYRPWLARHFEKHGHQEAALDIWRRQFGDFPGFDTYRELRRLATDLGIWETLRPALLAELDPKRHASLLLEIALDEKDVARALEIAATPGTWLDIDQFVRVAEAAEGEYPLKALEIYRRLAERAIAARSRANYQVAAGYLRRVRELYRRLDEEEAWEAYIARLREENKRLRALQDELNKAGL